MWQSLGSAIYFFDPDQIYSNKVAIFDLDGTLITSRSGNKYGATSGADVIFFPRVLATLRDLIERGLQIVIITNQSRYGPGIQDKLETVRQSIYDFTNQQPIILVATQKDGFRKPEGGLLTLLNQLIHPVEAFYSGDAVGPTDSYPPYRWEKTDKEFADRWRLTFYRPIEIFGELAIPEIPKVPTLILMKGTPGSGKSTIARQTGLPHCEQDILKTKVQACARSHLESGSSVIVDATHSSLKSIQEYRDLGYPMEIWWVLRHGGPFNALRDKPVPPVAYGVYTKHFETPESLGIPIRYI